MDNYAAHIFTEAVQAEQERAGMRERYAAVYEKRLREAFDGKARMFIKNCETAYIASNSANGWPYVQHRGSKMKPTALILSLIANFGAMPAMAQDSIVDLSPLAEVDTSVLTPGTCGPIREVAPFMYIWECPDDNPVITFTTGVAAQYAIDFAVSEDIAAECQRSLGCISASSVSVNGWTGGKNFQEGEFGNVVDILLVSGPSSVQISSRDTDDTTAQNNAEIALQLLQERVICGPYDGAAPTCPSEP